MERDVLHAGGVGQVGQEVTEVFRIFVSESNRSKSFSASAYRAWGADICSVLRCKERSACGRYRLLVRIYRCFIPWILPLRPPESDAASPGIAHYLPSLDELWPPGRVDVRAPSRGFWRLGKFFSPIQFADEVIFCISQTSLHDVI
jgi:hypothetical protein